MTAPPPGYLRTTRWRLVARVAPMATVITLWISGFPGAALGLFLLAFCVIGYVTLSPTTRLLGPVVTRLPDDSGVLITIDDGPHPDTTHALLDLLDRYQAKAVFFVIGKRVCQWPHLVLEIARRGHTLANHSQTHPAAFFWALGPRATWHEIAGCQQSLETVLGKAPVWFRAPVGHYNLFTHPALAWLGLRLISWSCRGFDGVDQNVPRILSRLEPDLKPGAIVLLHEGLASSAAVMEGTLKMIRERGLVIRSPDVRL